MRQEIYLCDNCRKILSKDGKGKQHLSVNFDRYSGWVEPQWGIDLDNMQKSEVLNWKHSKTAYGIKQFCNGKCLGEYFDKLLKRKSK